MQPATVNCLPTLQPWLLLPLPPRAPQVVLATNIAESSITIRGIRYVVDSCRTLQLRWDRCAAPIACVCRPAEVERKHLRCLRQLQSDKQPRSADGGFEAVGVTAAGSGICRVARGESACLPCSVFGLLALHCRQAKRTQSSIIYASRSQCDQRKVCRIAGRSAQPGPIQAAAPTTSTWRLQPTSLLSSAGSLGVCWRHPLPSSHACRAPPAPTPPTPYTHPTRTHTHTDTHIHQQPHPIRTPQGRTGRTCDGVVYRLLPRRLFLEHLPQFEAPHLTLLHLRRGLTWWPAAQHPPTLT